MRRAMNDAAGHLATTDPIRCDVGLYFYAGSAARDVGKLALFFSLLRIANEAFRLTQDRPQPVSSVCGPAKVCRSAQYWNTSWPPLRRLLFDVRPQTRSSSESRVRTQPEFRRAGISAVFRLPGRIWRAEHRVSDLSGCPHLPLIRRSASSILRPYCDAQPRSGTGGRERCALPG